LKKRSYHLTRVIVEGISSFSPYGGGKVTYKKEFDPNPIVNVAHAEKMDIERAVKILYQQGELTKQEIRMLNYVFLDGLLSRRQISEMIQKDEGIYVDQRTISKKLVSAYGKIQKFLGGDYGDEKLFRMIGRRMGKPSPYILSDEERDKAIQTWEKI
jgi:hypothetical protein